MLHARAFSPLGVAREIENRHEGILEADDFVEQSTQKAEKLIKCQLPLKQRHQAIGDFLTKVSNDAKISYEDLRSGTTPSQLRQRRPGYLALPEFKDPGITLN
jgi:hypothetical protein